MITFALTMKRSIILATFGLYSVSLAAPVLEVRDTANNIVNRSSRGTTVIDFTTAVPTRATSTNVELYDLVARSDSALASLTTYAPTPSSVSIPRHGSSYHPSHNSITLTSERPISTTKPSGTNPGSNLSQDGSFRYHVPPEPDLGGAYNNGPLLNEILEDERQNALYSGGTFRKRLVGITSQRRYKPPGP